MAEQTDRKLMWVTGLDTVSDRVVGPIRFEAATPADSFAQLDSDYWRKQYNVKTAMIERYRTGIRAALEKHGRSMLGMDLVDNVADALNKQHITIRELKQQYNLVKLNPLATDAQPERWGRVRDRIKELGLWQYASSSVSEQALNAIDTLNRTKEDGYKRANELAVERVDLKRELRDCKEGAFKVSASRVSNQWSERQHDDNMGVLKEKLVQLGQRQEGTWIAANAVTALDMLNRRIGEQAKQLAESRRACKELREERDAANRSRDALREQVVAAKIAANTTIEANAKARFARERGRLEARIDCLSRIVQEAKAKLDEAGVTFTGTHHHVTATNYQAQGGWVATHPYPIHAPEDMCEVCDARRSANQQPWDRA